MSAINFACKEKFSEYLVPKVQTDNKKRVLLGTILSGAFSGVVAYFFVYPLDLARTKITADTLSHK